MIHLPGTGRWATTAEVVAMYAGQEPEVDANLINVWRYRGKVRWHKVSRTVWVSVDDIADAERDWSSRVRPA